MTTVYSRRGALSWWLLAFGLFETGCASLSYENYGHAMDAAGHLAETETTPAGLVISGEEDAELSSVYTGFVALNFENHGSHWIRVQSMRVSFGGSPKDRTVFVPMGEDLTSWQRAMLQLKDVHDFNTEMALGGVVAASAVAAHAAGRDTSAGKTAAIVGGIAAVAALGSAIGEAAHSVAVPPMYPDTHLLATPFAVPPGLFTKRWIVLSTPGRPPRPCVESILLDYTLDDGRRERVWLTFRSQSTRSEWQSDVC